MSEPFVSVRLDGPEGAKYLPFAKKKARELYAQAKSSFGYGTKHLDLVDAQIQLNVTPSTISVYIKGLGGVDMLSGCVDQGYNTISNELYRFFPSSEQLAIEQPDATPPVGAWRTEQKLSALPQGDLLEAFSSTLNYAQAGSVPACMYTGEMEKVVQCLLGVPKLQIPYRYDFYKTHGIFKDINGKPWLIEISQNHGVLAMAFPTVAHLSKKYLTQETLIKADIGYIPAGKGFPEKQADLDAAIANGSVLQLLPATSMGDFYGKTAFFHDCGWAFSASGKLAQNTCWNYASGTGYTTSYRYQVTINSDPTTGAPTYATLDLQDSGPIFQGLWARSLRSSYFYVPLYAHVVNGGQYQVNMFPMSEMVNMTWRSPLYVYFVGEIAQVWGQYFNGTITPDYGPDFSGGSLVQDVSFYGPGFDGEASYQSTSSYVAPASVTELGRYFCGTPTLSSDPTVSGNSYHVNPGGNHSWNLYYAEFTEGHYQTEVDTLNGYISQHRNALIISPRNRSAVFTCDLDYLYYTSGTAAFTYQCYAPIGSAVTVFMLGSVADTVYYNGNSWSGSTGPSSGFGAFMDTVWQPVSPSFVINSPYGYRYTTPVSTTVINTAGDVADALPAAPNGFILPSAEWRGTGSANWIYTGMGGTGWEMAPGSAFRYGGYIGVGMWPGKATDAIPWPLPSSHNDTLPAVNRTTYSFKCVNHGVTAATAHDCSSAWVDDFGHFMHLTSGYSAFKTSCYNTQYIDSITGSTLSYTINLDPLNLSSPPPVPDSFPIAQCGLGISFVGYC